MSEYQYYEFQAVDRPLTKEQMAELRALSTRARITPTQLQNVYHYGNFKGDPLSLMETYFDAFVYVANWGTHWTMIRLPATAFDERTVRAYEVDGALEIHTRSERLILEFTSEDEVGASWIADEEAEGWMPALLPLRSDLIGGDLRALYIAWLAGAEVGQLDDDVLEPPVPAGLDRLSASLTSLAAFLRLGDDLLAVAAANSRERSETESREGLEDWIANLPAPEKDALLLRLARGDGAHARAEILRRHGEATSPATDGEEGRRTVADLLRMAEEHARTRRRAEAERKAADQARQDREREASRARYLDSLEGRDEELWRRVDALVETKRQNDYDEAVRVLNDLHDLSVRQGTTEAFSARLVLFRNHNAKRPSLLQRLHRAGLTP